MYAVRQVVRVEGRKIVLDLVTTQPTTEITTEYTEHSEVLRFFPCVPRLISRGCLSSYRTCLIFQQSMQK